MKGNKTFRMMSLMVLISLIASHLSGQVNLLQPTWLWLAAIASLMAFQATYTGFCPAHQLMGGKGVAGGCCGNSK